LGIFSLSFAVPVLFWMLTQRDVMRPLSRLVNSALVVLAVTGCGLGLWAAVQDIINKWHVCHYRM
jgi:hypothetical protein